MKIVLFMLTTVVKRRKILKNSEDEKYEIDLSKNPRKTHAKHPIPCGIKDAEFLKFNSHFV